LMFINPAGLRHCAPSCIDPAKFSLIWMFEAAPVGAAGEFEP